MPLLWDSLFRESCDAINAHQIFNMLGCTSPHSLFQDFWAQDSIAKVQSYYRWFMFELTADFQNSKSQISTVLVHTTT